MKVIVSIKPVKGESSWIYEIKSPDGSLDIMGRKTSSEFDITGEACKLITALEADPVFETTRKFYRLSELIPADKHGDARISLFEYGLVARRQDSLSFTSAANVIAALETDFEEEEDVLEYLKLLPSNTSILMDL